MIVSQIAAMSKNRVIGRHGKLPWNIPEDMKFFRETTKNSIVIMGRKTWESIGSKPLPNRLNIVVTRSKDFSAEGARVAHTVDQALEIARGESAKWGDEVFVIGGAEIYRQAMPATDRIYLTEIEGTYNGDAFFPEFDRNEFKLVKKTDHHGPVNFSFCVYEKH